MPADPTPLLRALDRSDTDQALALYTELTFGPDCVDAAAFLRVLDHPGTTVMGALRADELVAMVTVHVLPNVTWTARPYALIENVVTKSDHRKQGLGRRALQAALQVAWDADAYKVMLLTGQHRGAKGFYEAVGFTSEDKYAMVMRRS